MTIKKKLSGHGLFSTGVTRLFWLQLDVFMNEETLFLQISTNDLNGFVNDGFD